MKSNKHISDKSGFKVPKSYFEDFEIKRFDIEKHKQNSGFSVPENYFDDFEVKIPQQRKLVNLNEKQKSFAIAASLLLLLGSLLLGLILKPKPQQEFNFSKIDQSVIEDYLEYEMFMENDLYVENEDFFFKFSTKNLSQNEIIDNMDDSSLEQLIDY
ncbi:MAG: hypothetical protein GVY05_04160 [Bacteroidetes bacterium]|jgi:hypothetical protein|nr:hypothetical protein [Bacteroidota bacterium]